MLSHLIQLDHITLNHCLSYFFLTSSYMGLQVRGNNCFGTVRTLSDILGAERLMQCVVVSRDGHVTIIACYAIVELFFGLPSFRLLRCV